MRHSKIRPEQVCLFHRLQSVPEITEVKVGVSQLGWLWCNQQRVGIITRMDTPPESSFLFKGRHFDSSIIILCVRWYITYKLSYRDLRDVMAERGIDLAHTTILRWVQRYIPEFEKQWQRYLRPIGLSWRMDETYIRVRGEWKYPYRAADYQGNTVDFLLSERRDIEAAKQFFPRAIERCGAPEKITVDAYPATHSAIAALKKSDILPQQVPS